MASLIGKEIGKYHITELVGRGGMADVYLGVHTHLDRKVAIKVLHSYLLERDGDFIERFKREAKAVANLQHPNIVQVYDFDIQDDTIIMVMEYIDGVNLQQQLVEFDKKRKHLPIKQIGTIINDIASALDYAHSKKILHRDVKPSNILIDKQGKAYLTDFGIAKIVGEHKFTATGTLMGTPAYMSPEQGRGEDLTEESDIYSLGVVAFEMLTGRVPFDAKTPIGIIQKQISEPVPEISKIVQGVPETAQKVIDKALSKSPKGRYGSAEELVDALKIALQALESTKTTQVMTAPKTETTNEEILSAPTVAMNKGSSTDEYEKPTVLMQEDGKAQKRVETSPPESISTEEITLAQKPKRKIPLWGMITAGVVVVGAVAVALTQFIGAGNLNQKNVPIIFDADHTSDNLYLLAGYDRDVESVMAGNNPEQAWRTGNGAVLPSTDNNQIRDNYIGFLIDDGYIYDVPKGVKVSIDVEYLDKGTDWFNMTYDAHSGGPLSNGSNFETEGVQKTNSGEFLHATFILDNARFTNSFSDYDFRICDAGDGAETIRRVTVTILP